MTRDESRGVVDVTTGGRPSVAVAKSQRVEQVPNLISDQPLSARRKKLSGNTKRKKLFFRFQPRRRASKRNVSVLWYKMLESTKAAVEFLPVIAIICQKFQTPILTVRKKY